MDWEIESSSSSRRKGLKKLRVRKVNTVGHEVAEVASRPPWAEPSRFTAPWTLQAKPLKYSWEEQQQQHVVRIQNGT